ncbi:hypothetical protein PG985_010517 [Apiospora marii]|uniref:uncharacterized protein n=1 Tax=Apiospora marii TaxID=335849 RepID=UPI00312ED48D
MQLRTLLFSSFMGICLAQRWKIDQSCGEYSSQRRVLKATMPLESAFTQARDLATNAYSVLEEHYGADAHVQQMVKYILGDDTDLQEKVDTVKDAFRGVKTYEPAPFSWLDTFGSTNTDVLVYCDGSNFNTHTRDDGMVLHQNKAMGGALVSPGDWPMFDACFNKDPAHSDKPIPMAITISSDGEDKKAYDRAMAVWGATGAKGRRAGPRTVRETATELTEHHQSLQGLQNNNRAINKLSETMGATFLHELTHTNQGGKLIDNLKDGDCYGWVCVTRLRDPMNSDSVNVLGVVLKVWSLGFFVDQDGRIQKKN